jgi:hypothetical protein
MKDIIGGNRCKFAVVTDVSHIYDTRTWSNIIAIMNYHIINYHRNSSIRKYLLRSLKTQAYHGNC